MPADPGAILDRIREYKRPSSTNALKLLECLDTDKLDGLEDALGLLDEYTNIERGDYDDAEAYAEARADAWQEFIDALDEIQPIDEE